MFYRPGLQNLAVLEARAPEPKYIVLISCHSQFFLVELRRTVLMRPQKLSHNFEVSKIMNHNFDAAKIMNHNFDVAKIMIHNFCLCVEFFRILY